MGKLFLVPTPIGNLDDMTFRAVEVLKSVHLILAEDTRTSSKLLKHYNISTNMHSHHKFNEHQTTQNIIKQLQDGQNIALISDAGTPAISDPGYLLVSHCIEEGIEVDCLPGATAFVPALVNSGLPCTQFCFEGFLPVKKGRQTRITQLATEERTLIFYESPHRLVKTLTQLADAWGSDRAASVSREISKFFEETQRATLSELATYYTEHPPKGEIVLIVKGALLEKKKKRQYHSDEQDEQDEQEAHE